MTFQALVIILDLAVGVAPLPQPQCIPEMLQVQGQTLYCCTSSTGQRCCSQRKVAEGKVLGCGC